MPIACKVRGSGAYTDLQFVHIFLTSRWASAARSDALTKNGFTPISTSRVTALGASLVCRVLNTMWPVSEAFIAISAVSRSRISPIMMMFGAWRSIERKAAANVIPTSLRTCTWFMPVIWYSTGSSTVMIFRSGWFRKFSAEYRVVDLPDPVGPVTRNIPSAIPTILSNTAWSSEKNPSSGSPSLKPSLSRIRITMLSPYTVGRLDTRKSISLLLKVICMRPSCGTRFSAMDMFAISFSLDIIDGCRRFGGFSTSISTPSMR